MEKEMSNGGSALSLIYSQKEANCRPPRPRAMMVFLCMQQSLVKSNDCRGGMGSGDSHVPSIATRRPRPQAVRARGAPHLPFGFA